MKLYFTITCILLTLLSCKKDKKDTIALDYAYIGGEIINPNTKYIVLSKDETVIDTVDLDGRNRFIYKIDKLNDGLYTFRHGGEYQLILLEQEDSLLLRLNTLDFDESLVYSGNGGKKNNYFINEFIKNEGEEKYIVELCQLDGETFQKRVDSIKASKEKALENFANKYEPSQLFLRIAKANIDYSYYSSKEAYPFMHYGKNKAAVLKSLPDNFYDYRKDINYNDSFLIHNFNYNKFLRSNFNNLTLETHDKHETNACYDRKSLCYNLDRLKLIDSLILNPTIKDDLLYHFTMGYLSRNKNIADNSKLLKSYLEKSKSEKGKKMMSRYTINSNVLKEGSRIPNIKIINYKNNVLSLASQINSPTVLSFWSHKYRKHFKETHFKLKELKIKYPEVTFITINMDDSDLSKSKKFLESNGFYSAEEFKFKNPEESLDILAIYPMTKTILVDKNKKIVNSNTNLFSVHFEEQLLGLINR
ncbi:TlpA family protein disulfide reductase [Algibacter sp. R77976]|uniref:TlpA family protein disulfide reductase n=1 Tax=Algibacter sp. R77976 TaxID=3093873 RepID=UPI0037C625C1